MFQVRNLTITHKKDLTTLVERLSFVLAPGDRAAIIGEEGNGKSTVLKLLYDSSLVEPYVEWTGEIMDNGLRKGYLAQELRPEELSAPVWEFCQSSPGGGPRRPVPVRPAGGAGAGHLLRLAAHVHPVRRGACEAALGPAAAG